MRKRMGRFGAVMMVLSAIAMIAPSGAMAGPAAAKPSPESWANNPRSGAALNRDAAKDPQKSPAPIYGDDAKMRVLGRGVNNTAADATARDTQSETTIQTLSNGTKVIVGWNDSGSFTGANNHFTGWANSTNSGLSFTDRGAFPNSAEGDAGDPVLAADTVSTLLYMSTLGFTTGENLQVFKSSDGGATFGAPVNGTPGFGGTGDFQDKEWMTVDNFAGVGQHNVYLCWTRFIAAGGAQIKFTRSTDLGASFGPSTGLLLSTGGQGCYVAVGPDHSVYVFYYRGTGAGGQGGDNKLFVRRSTDKGVSFAAEVMVADLLTTTTNGNLALPGGMRSNSFPHAAVNPSNGHIYVVYNDNPADADVADCFMVISTNLGATWGAPVQVNNDDGGRSQFFPTVEVATNGAGLMIGYYSRAWDALDLAFHRQSRIAVITLPGGGLTWRTSFQLGPDTPVVIGQDPVINATYMGDYDQIDASAGFFHTAWSDNRDGNAFHKYQPDVRYARIDQTPATTNPNIALTGMSSGVVGDNITLRATITQGTAVTADDIFAVVTVPTGLIPKSVVPNGGGTCNILGQVVGCYMGSVASGVTKVIDIVAFAATAGTKVTTGRITTSDFDTAMPSPSFTTTVTGSGTTVTYGVQGAFAIADNATVDVPLSVPDDGAILTLLPRVRLNHTFDSDVDIYLISPAGTVVELSTDNGSSGDNYGTGTNDCAGTKTIFSDSAGASITTGVAPFASTFKPEAPLSALSSENPQGGWILRVSDDATIDTGTLGCFQLTVTRRP